MRKLLVFLYLMAFCTLYSKEYDFEVDKMRFKLLSDNTVELTSGYNYGMYSGDFIVPEHVTYKGVDYTVTSIDAFFDCPDLLSLTIPETITKIARYSLAACPKLKEIYIPKSVIDFGSENLTFCPNLEKIVVDPENPYYSSDGCNAIIEGTTLLSGCNTTTIPAYIKTIAGYAFQGSGINKLKVPEGVTAIHERAFRCCEKLEVLEMPYSLISVGEFLFDGCPNLKLIKDYGSEQYYNELFWSSQYVNVTIAVPERLLKQYTDNSPSMYDKRSIKYIGYNDNQILIAGDIKGYGQLFIDDHSLTTAMVANKNSEYLVNFVPFGNRRIMSVFVDNKDITDDLLDFSYVIQTTDKDIYISANIEESEESKQINQNILFQTDGSWHLMDFRKFTSKNIGDLFGVDVVFKENNTSELFVNFVQNNTNLISSDIPNEYGRFGPYCSFSYAHYLSNEDINTLKENHLGIDATNVEYIRAYLVPQSELTGITDLDFPCTNKIIHNLFGQPDKLNNGLKIVDGKIVFIR